MKQNPCCAAAIIIVLTGLAFATQTEFRDLYSDTWGTTDATKNNNFIFPRKH